MNIKQLQERIKLLREETMADTANTFKAMVELGVTVKILYPQGCLAFNLGDTWVAYSDVVIASVPDTLQRLEAPSRKGSKAAEAMKHAMTVFAAMDPMPQPGKTKTKKVMVFTLSSIQDGQQ